MLKSEFVPILNSGCLNRDMKHDRHGTSRPLNGCNERRLHRSCPYESRDFPHYDASSGSEESCRTLLDHGSSGSNFETTLTSTVVGEWDAEQCAVDDDDEELQTRGRFDKNLPFAGNEGRCVSRNSMVPSVRLVVAHLEPISIRPKNKNPHIVNVCQTFRFPDNIITQNNINKMTQQQDHHFHQQRDVPSNRQQHQHLPFHYNLNLSRSRLSGFYGVNGRHHRSMHSQTSRTLLELVESEQIVQPQRQQSPTTHTLQHVLTSQRMVLPASGSESNIAQPRVNHKRKIKILRCNKRQGNVRSLPVPFFDRTHVVDVGASMEGHYGRSTQFSRMAGIGKQARQFLSNAKLDHRKLSHDDLLESPFVGDPLVSITSRGRKQHLPESEPLDDDEELLDDGDDNGVDEQGCRMKEHDRCKDLDAPEDDEDGESEDGIIRDPYNRAGERVAGGKEKSGISAIMDKLHDNLWAGCLEGILDLMDMAGQIDWKVQEKYITVINRKLIKFLKSPRTALCRSACQVSGELFREAKSTTRPEFDEIVDILLCKTADPNRFIQKDANVALDKLVTYIPTSHTVRALSNRGPIHRNPLVRTATARLLVCICVVAGLDAILGTNANTRTRKTILSMLAKILTDKNLETRKFGERLYRMLRKHRFFEEYFYKDMDSNLRTNLKRVLKSL